MPRIRLLQKRGIILIVFSLTCFTYWIINSSVFVSSSSSKAVNRVVEPTIDHGHVLLKNAIAARRIRSILEREISRSRNTSDDKHTVYSEYEDEGEGNASRAALPLCSAIPPVVGRVFVDFNHTHNMTRQDVIRQHKDLQMGGIWRPAGCVARHRVAIIIPYRDREQHLVTLLSHLLPILKRQELAFQIFVTEQTGNDTFNKARIMNAAFKEAIKMYDFQCFVFHDVDLIPEDDRNMYSCPVQPRHMSVAIDEMDYKVPYDYLVGGVLSMRTEHFQMVNGYSNLYWGWGAEDDDMAFRIMHVGLKITRPPSIVARYKMIKHEKRTPTDWKKRSRLLRTGVRRFNFDGLNSVNYNLVSITKRNLFTHVLVDIGKPPSLT